MKKTKEGMAHFETEAEIRNFMRINYSKEAILDKARNRKRTVSYQNPDMEGNGLLKAVESLPNERYREGKQLMTTLVRCAIERARIVSVMDTVHDPLQKKILRDQAASITPQHVYAYYMKEWHYTFEHIHTLEKRTTEAIENTLSHIGIPLNCGEIAEEAHI